MTAYVCVGVKDSSWRCGASGVVAARAQIRPLIFDGCVMSRLRSWGEGGLTVYCDCDPLTHRCP